MNRSKSSSYIHKTNEMIFTPMLKRKKVDFRFIARPHRQARSQKILTPMAPPTHNCIRCGPVVKV